MKRTKAIVQPTLLATALLLIGLSLAACSGKKESGGSTGTVSAQSGTEQITPATTAEHLRDFNEAQKKLIASFGKTEKGKKIVAFEKLSFGVQYDVSVYSGETLTAKEYVIYFPSREEGFKTVRHSENDEVDETTLSVCTTETYSGSKASPFDEMYQYYKYEDDNYTVVE
jgi:hypothetical protein